MNKKIELSELLSGVKGATDRIQDLFAIVNLGLVEALVNGLLDAEDAVRIFYNAENCLYVKKNIKNKIADKIMSSGVQLPDLFDVLPVGESRKEFLRELATMRGLCLKMLEDHRSVA
jgi:hypothetical protein